MHSHSYTKIRTHAHTHTCTGRGVATSEDYLLLVKMSQCRILSLTIPVATPVSTRTHHAPHCTIAHKEIKWAARGGGLRSELERENAGSGASPSVKVGVSGTDCRARLAGTLAGTLADR